MFLCGACTYEIPPLIQQLQLSFPKILGAFTFPHSLSCPPGKDTISPQLHWGYHVLSPNQTLSMHTGWWKTRGACEFSKRKSNEPCDITAVLQCARICRSCQMHVVLHVNFGKRDYTNSVLCKLRISNRCRISNGGTKLKLQKKTSLCSFFKKKRVLEMYLGWHILLPLRNMFLPQRVPRSMEWPQNCLSWRTATVHQAEGSLNSR